MDEARELGVLVDEVAQFVANDKLQFVARHQVEESRVDVDDVGLVLVLRGHREGVDRRVAGDVEIHLARVAQLVFHLMAEVVEVAEQLLLHLEAVSLHVAPPISVAARGAYLPQHLFHDAALQGVVDLLAQLPFQFDCRVELILLGHHRLLGLLLLVVLHRLRANNIE